MSRLSRKEIEDIASKKKLIVLNPENYTSLNSQLEFKCLKCSKTFMSCINIVRSPNFLCPRCQEQSIKHYDKVPQKTENTYRIVGFDQATKNFGISVFDNGVLVYYGLAQFVGTTEERCVKIAKFIKNVCEQWKPDFVEFEDIQLQNQYSGFKTFKVLAELMGVVKTVLTLEKVEHDLVLNKVWQSMFMIGGKTRVVQKNNVVKKVHELFGITVVDDIADAILIGKYAVNKMARQKQAF